MPQSSRSLYLPLRAGQLFVQVSCDFVPPFESSVSLISNIRPLAESSHSPD